MFYEVVLDAGETPNKCTISPLSYRKDFRLFSAKGAGPIGPLEAPILLHHEGVCLTTLLGSKINGLACIDCVWRRLEGLVIRSASQEQQLVRIPDGFETAYPRKSKPGNSKKGNPNSGKPKPGRSLAGSASRADENVDPLHFSDPPQGLATIEAIFIASALLGKWDLTLLSEYYFANQFLEKNRNRLVEFGVNEALLSTPLPPMGVPTRNSQYRRQQRGKIAIRSKS